MTIGRWVAAAAAGGFTNLVVGFAMAHLAGIAQLQTELASHGLRRIGEPSDVLPHVTVRLVLGTAVMLLYTLAAARLGPGPRAAWATAALAWLFVPAFTAWGHAHIGLFPTRLAWTFAGSGAVEMLATAFASGWVVTGSRFWR